MAVSKKIISEECNQLLSALKQSVVSSRYKAMNAHPNAARQLIVNAWELERKKNVQIVNDILQSALKN